MKNKVATFVGEDGHVRKLCFNERYDDFDIVLYLARYYGLNIKVKSIELIDAKED